MAKILLIDCSRKELRMAIGDNTGILALYNGTEKQQQASTIHTEINTLLQANGWNFEVLEAIGVVSGPGSYTGLRIGLSVAKGYSYARQTPLILTSGLELLCREHVVEKKNFSGGIIKAREGEYYVQVLNQSNEIHIEPRHITVEEFLKDNFLTQEVHWTSYEQFPELNSLMNTIDNTDPVIWNNIAQQAFANKMFSDLNLSKPLYIKDVFIYNKKK